MRTASPVEFARDRHRGDRARFTSASSPRRCSDRACAELAGGARARWSAKLGAPEGEPQALDGGITNRNFRVTLGGRDSWCGCRARTPSCSGSTATAERAATARRPPPASARRWSRYCPSPPCLVTRVHRRAGRCDRGGAARARRLADVAAALRAVHDGGAAARRRASTRSRVVDGYARDRPRARRRGPAAVPRGRARGARADPRGAHGPRARAGARATTTCCPRTSLDDGDAAADRRLGVRGDGRPLLRPRQPRRSTTASPRPTTSACSRPTSASRRRRGRLRRAAADADHVRLPRGHVGRRADARSPTLDFDFAGYADEHLARAAAGLADPRFDDLAGGRRAPLTLPAARALRDHRRRRRRDVDRLPPGRAGLARRRAARPQPAHERLDVPLGGPGRPAARLGLADAR